VPRNEAEAARWFGLAAAQGDPIGEHRLALLLLAGKGVEKDTGKAVELLRHGADRGYVPAQVALAMAFEAVRPSRTGLAYIWYRIAGRRTADAALRTLANNGENRAILYLSGQESLLPAAPPICGNQSGHRSNSGYSAPARRRQRRTPGPHRRPTRPAAVRGLLSAMPAT
jgi:TPR repeat protein